MKTSEFEYHLPESLIAQHPVEPRDSSRLLVLDRHGDDLQHRHFSDLPDFMRAGDVLVVNDSRVIPARIFGRKPTGGRVEVLLLEKRDRLTWQALVGGRHMTAGATLTLLDHTGEPTVHTATVVGVGEESLRDIAFNDPVEDWLEDIGYPPLPPYIHETLDDPERYQTIFARPSGSAAAPTAGLHFTPDLMFELRSRGVLLETVTLHVGLDTFKPVVTEEVTDHVIHSEWARLTAETARRINDAKLAGGRIIAVGTTSTRVLETGACRSAGITGSLQTISQRDASGETSNMCPWKPVAAFEGATDLFITPGYRYRAVAGLITNFHLPRSSLLMLVAAFAERERMMRAYEAAIAESYRFFSFGDAMLII